ncbi:MAG: Crp/Fnr family transcriptional regulator [Sphingobacteriales bacterium]|nr:MAG: Crp/Fnr family transcriptional regulator [Sphingobacteriales bacterium]
MIDFSQLAFYARIFKGLRLEDVKDVAGLFKFVQLQPGELFLEEGAVRKSVGYIRKGMIRAYIINEKGEDITFLLLNENRFVASHDVILLNRPSRYFYEAIEPTEILQMDFHLMQTIIQRNPKLEESRKEFLHQMLCDSLTHLESFVLYSPEERYIKFVESNPDIINRVPGKYIAHVLGITPVSLSRIRKRIAKRKR